MICAVVGSYLMVQRLALLGDAISHSVLPGLAIAFMIGANIFIGAFIAGVLSTMAIAWIRARSPIKEDAAMGIVFSACFALGITLITLIQRDNKIDLNHFLFGNILAVSRPEVWQTALISALVLVVVVLLYKEPGATAYLLVNRLHQVMILGAGIGIVSSISGMYLSYFFNLPSGPAIVLVVSGLFVLALLFSPTHGVFTQPQAKSGESMVWRELKGLIRRP